MKTWIGAVTVSAAALLSGCAGLNAVTADVSSYGPWPEGRAPGSYAFDRLPSQQARAAETERLELDARTALQKAGFVPAAAGAQPDVLVQVGARVTRQERVVWDDPLWWHGGWGYGRYSPWYGPYWGPGFADRVTRYDAEAALLIRDRASGQPLFEARASVDDSSSVGDRTLAAMYEAALADFPKTGVNPRRVTVQLPPAPR